ncbi:hypothetical protein P8A22_18255 [Streptomyces laculatispora]|uniref:Uncharacterized protein n=1 Tax=Streptomyces laculatispora TaxID=887464 RepID=A0ABY9I6L4_9ACTN|nr:hypothetical protein [Streptomyces laculatispora]WLQ41758.1 hypothetical protein P8A22_18255 [Streptomyces laculatispora]
MSAPEERGALTPRPSLYSYALRLHRAEPEGRFPGKGYELPDPSEPKRQGSRSWAKTRAALTDLLGPLLLAPDPVRAAERLQRQLSELTQAVRSGHIRRVVSESVLEDQARARALARCLTRAGSTSEAVCVGLSPLARLGEPEDVPYLRILGQLRVLVGPAVRALDAIDRPVGALVWLGHHAETSALRGLVDALVAGDDAAVRGWLLAVPREPGTVAPETARRIAEAVRAADLLSADGPVDAELEGCCGALHVTIRRDGDEVVWSDWRCPPPPSSPLQTQAPRGTTCGTSLTTALRRRSVRRPYCTGSPRWTRGRTARRARCPGPPFG